MALPRVSSSSLPPLSLVSHRPRVPDLGFIRLCPSRSETLECPLFLDGSPSSLRDPLGMIRRVGSHYSHLVRFSSKPSEQYDEDCDSLTVWLKQGSDLSAFVHCASEDHMKALFDLLDILKDLEVVVVKGTVDCEASILLRSVFITRLPCKVEYLGELIKNKMASTDVVQKYPKVSGEQMGTAEDIGNKKLYADSATSLRFVYNGPRTSVMLIETAHNPAVPCEIIKGQVAKAKFHLSFGLAALSKFWCQITWLLRVVSSCIVEAEKQFANTPADALSRRYFLALEAPIK